MSQFEPVAIVGQGCVLPGATSPEALWEIVREKRIVTQKVSPERLGLKERGVHNPKWVSGLVDDLSIVYDDQVRLLDPVCRWPLQAATEAWREAETEHIAPARRGVVLANLLYPSRAKAAYAADIWQHGQTKRPFTDTLNADYPAHLIASHIEAAGPVLALDAACASSLYALDIACQKLAQRQIDIAIVAGVSAADNLILHIGFEALKALSPTGRSRPFIAGADGLIPSEGAAAVTLKRLSDVVKGEKVYGVIRSIGLSNDGRRKGLLAPDSEGQCEAMSRAYKLAGIDPDSINFLECHATGTPIGDSVEIQSAANIFGQHPLPIGSLKANTGHLITVAGLASLLKLTQAMEAETLPAMPLDGSLLPLIGETGLSPLSEPHDWIRRSSPRRAAISNFGFGGNNSHLILEQYEPLNKYVNGSVRPIRDDIVICGIGLSADPDRGERAILRRLMNAPIQGNLVSSTIEIDPAHAKTPPSDLLRAEPQQLAILDVAATALESICKPAPDRCGVFTGVRSANDSARWLLRERIASEGIVTQDELNAIAPPLIAADVLGAMANMTANRLTVAEDFRGRGFALATSGSSGLAALDAASDALNSGAIDLAVVATADFATEIVAHHNMETSAGDLSTALVLKRRKDAEREGDHIFGTVSTLEWGCHSETADPFLENIYGRAAASDALFEIGVKLALSARGLEIQSGLAAPSLSRSAPPFSVISRSAHASTHIRADIIPDPARPSPDMLRPTPYLYWASAGSPGTLSKKLSEGKSGGRGKYRIALVANSETDLNTLKDTSIRQLMDGEKPQGENIFYGEGDPEGEMAFAFTGSAASYPRMGRSFLAAFPEIREKLADITAAQTLTSLLGKSSLTEFEQLCAVSLVTQAHTFLLRDFLELQPDAALGLSLGESNALFAFGFWKDMGALLKDISDAAMYERHIGGEFETARTAWGSNVPADWTNWRVRAPIADIRTAIADYPEVEITIIYSDIDAMIGGPSDACRQAVARLGKGAGALMHQHLIVHAEAMRPFAEKWKTLHTRSVSRVENAPRIYSNAINSAYKPSKSKVADMLTRQAVSTVDFPATVHQAWKDGVRTFVELGPRDTLTQSIRRVLASKPHNAVATDIVERSDLAQLAYLAAALFAEGRHIRIDWLAKRLDEVRKYPWPTPKAQSFRRDVHYPPPVVPEAYQQRTEQSFPSAPPRLPVRYETVTSLRPTPGPVAFPPPPSATKQVPLDRPGPESVLSGNTPLLPRRPSGPAWARKAIEASARGPMSEFFGKEFRQQDQYARNVRLPAPPLLLVDRITGLDAKPLTEGKGVIWTETDLTADHWMMHNGRIRPGPLIECGQADLTLIGWMGADLKNQDERVYRLLGCEITFHEGGLPKAGETLKFQIEITQHANFGGVRMFFFQYDCLVGNRSAFSVRQGQAGFFTDQELTSGKGVVWDPSVTEPPTPEISGIDLSRASEKKAFSKTDVSAFSRGDAYACFGPGFELCAAQSFPAHLPAGKLSFIEDVPVFDPAGGPWKRGYLLARAHVPKDAWFYEGHFHNDPCMPGTLMAEAAVQALEFYAAALGLTQERDGYVFEPVPGAPAKFICRGQVIPDTDHDLTYEVFIDEVIDGETPKIFASLLASSDGKKVFYCPRFGVQLRRIWPEPRRSPAPLRVGPEKESRGDYAALLDCANGAPSAAFGEMYRKFDTEGRVPRLPQPPYHMMSRVLAVSERPGIQRAGISVSAEYDIPPDAWYFTDNPNGEMPFSVLSEIMLQPCGWLASHCGFALDGGDRFRNLEGDGHVFTALKAHDGTICVETVLTSFSKVGPMTIVAFDVNARLKSGAPIMRLTTRFGFFPAAALIRQAGLPVTDQDRAYLTLPPAISDLTRSDTPLAKGRLQMLDGVDYFDPEGGSAKLGLTRAHQKTDPYAWYFKAHFMGDPVQPGSLGLDALVQLLTRAAWLKGLANDIPDPYIETLAADMPVKWTYRGQVTPEKERVTTVMEILNITDDARRRIIMGRGSLWCDGLRIYEANPISIALSPRG